MLPNLELPIEDRNAAEFWQSEFAGRFRETGDKAYQEAHKAVTRYIDNVWPDWNE